MARKVTLEERLIDGHVLYANDDISFDSYDAVDHQERITVRQDAHHCFGVHRATVGDCVLKQAIGTVRRPRNGWRGKSLGASNLRSHAAYQFAIGSMTGFDRHQVPTD